MFNVYGFFYKTSSSEKDLQYSRIEVIVAGLEILLLEPFLCGSYNNLFLSIIIISDGDFDSVITVI